MPKDVRRFFFKAFLISVPAIALLAAYVLFDPFKVLRSYESYYVSGVPSYVQLDSDVVSTETFRKHQATRQYDSFIFGSSRTRFYRVADWQTHIHSTRCFHFDGSGESIYGVHAKVEYLDRVGARISNALLVMDSGLLAVTGNGEGHLFRKDPVLSGESQLNFQMLFLKTFLDPKFCTAYLQFRAAGHLYDYMVRDSLLDDLAMNYDSYYNEIRFDQLDSAISSDPASYYAARRGIFYVRSPVQTFSPPVIGPVQRTMLSEIAQVLARQGSNIRVVISPLYDQKKLDPGDLKYLREVFGSENVYDFSGINKITQTETNYYETSHYRPPVAREIMTTIYAPRTSLPPKQASTAR